MVAQQICAWMHFIPNFKMEFQPLGHFLWFFYLKIVFIVRVHEINQ